MFPRKNSSFPKAVVHVGEAEEVRHAESVLHRLRTPPHARIPLHRAPRPRRNPDAAPTSHLPAVALRSAEKVWHKPLLAVMRNVDTR